MKYFFPSSIKQGVITKGWTGLSNGDQVELRTTLYHWLLEKHQFAPYFIRNKVNLPQEFS
jgi:hypothetical protein